MSSFDAFPPTAEKVSREHFTEDARSDFRHRALGTRRWLLPRRYVVALLLCIILVIQVSRHLNVALTLTDIVMSGSGESSIFKLSENSSIGNWTVGELEKLSTYMQIGCIFANIIGALLIYEFSSHKFLLVSVTVSSILHMLTPTAMNHHSVTFFLLVTIGHDIISVPTYIAILSTWKDWAPPEEKTCLVTISLCALTLQATGGVLYLLLFPYAGEIINYYLGIAGLIWVLFWYNITADTPQNDPLISENEYLYLESKIPSNTQEKVKLKDVPWKSIMKSTQIMILCSIYFNMGCSIDSIQVVGLFLMFHLKDTRNRFTLFLPFASALIVILIGSSVLIDFLLNKYKSHALKIRKYFLCGGFLLQCLLMLGAAIVTSSWYLKMIFFIMAYSAFALSVPGSFTYPLDLSSRYVSLIAGIGFASFCFGSFTFHFFVEHAFQWSGPHTISWIFLFDGIISLCTALIFGIWGDVEEQQWSLIVSSHHRGHDYMSYPKPDDDEDLNLVPGNFTDKDC